MIKIGNLFFGFFAMFILNAWSVRAETIINLSSYVNKDISGFGYSGAQGYPEHGGTIKIDDVPFSLAALNGETATIEQSYDIPTAPSSIKIATNLRNPTTVYTLINSSWGSSGSLIGSLTFSGAKSDDKFIYNLVEGVNVRDELQNTFENSIDSSTLLGSAYFKSSRFDAQEITLPSSFVDDSLTSITFTSNGLGFPNGVPFLSAITVASSAAPEPSTWTLLIAGVAVAGGALRSRRRGWAAA